MASPVKSRFARNLVASVLAQLLRYGAPLAFYPYLTRTLGADGFAAFALAFAAAVMLGQLVEFGFGLSGVRALAEAHEDRPAAAQVVGDVLVGRALTAIGFGSIATLIWWALPGGGDVSTASAAMIGLLALGYGFSSSWYFIGREQAARLAGLEILTSFSQLALLIAYVRPGSGPEVAVAAMAAPVWIVLAVGHTLALRELGVAWPDTLRLKAGFLESFRLFCFTGIMPILNRANLLVLGALSTPTQVAWYAVGERIVTAAANAMVPVIRVAMPRITKLLQDAPDAAARLFSQAFWGLTGLAAVGATVGAVLAPWGVPLVFGEDLRGGALVVAIQLFIVPAMMGSRTIGTMGLVPLRLEKEYQRAVLISSIGGLCLAPIAVWCGGGVALAVLRVGAEAALVAYAALVLARNAPEWLASPIRRVNGAI